MKFKHILILIFLISTIFSLSACGSPGAALEDVTWVLESHGQPGNLKAVLEDTEITAEFVSAERAVKGSAGCNSYGGGYEINKNELTFPSPLISTMMACPEPIMNQESDYLSALQVAESYEIEGSKLQINCGSRVLIFKPK